MKNNLVFTIIAGVNGSGKTTFAIDYLKTAFVNTDLIATGLSPINPDIKQFLAARLMLKEIDFNIKNNTSFAVETTLSSKRYIKVIKNLKQQGWVVRLVYLYLPSIDLSIKRVAERVKNGGHNIKLQDIKRRYSRSIKNFINAYFYIIDDIKCIDNAHKNRTTIFIKHKNNIIIFDKKKYNKILEFKND